MNHVYLVTDKDKNVIAIYTTVILANKMKPALEKQLNVELKIEERSVNQDLKMIGLFK